MPILRTSEKEEALVHICNPGFPMVRKKKETRESLKACGPVRVAYSNRDSHTMLKVRAAHTHIHTGMCANTQQ